MRTVIHYGGIVKWFWRGVVTRNTGMSLTLLQFESLQYRLRSMRHHRIPKVSLIVIKRGLVSRVKQNIRPLVSILFSVQQWLWSLLTTIISAPRRPACWSQSPQVVDPTPLSLKPNFQRHSRDNIIHQSSAVTTANDQWNAADWFRHSTIFIVLRCALDSDFYPRDGMLARVFAIATCLSVRPSVRPSVCHTPVLCLAERKQDREMYTIW